MSAPAVATPERTAFVLAAKLACYDADALISSAEYRRAVTKADPLMFALCYLAHHLRDDSTNNQITFSEFHLDLFEQAKQWMRLPSGPGEERDCYVAPRGAGKSTMCFLVLPLWAAAHGWVRFIGAYADSATQAQIHLQSFKMELDNNKLLRNDFPELCASLKRPGGQNVSDSRGMVVSESGFVFAARGVTSSTLGMKVGNRRPDMLLLDDIEPQEGDYSAEQKIVRLQSVIESIFQLNIFARVVIAGTVTMHGSIIHDLVRTVTEADPPAWVASERIRTHYYPALVTDPDTGAERSLWPGKWPLDYLQSRRSERDFKKNMQNQPVGPDGAYWVPEDFRFGSPEGVTRRILSVDPAVTSKTTSDFTGLSVVGFSPSAQQCVVEGAWAVKLAPAALRQRILQILELHPGIRCILVETNQGGDTWAEVLSPMPPGVKLLSVHQSEPKPVRAAKVLDYYQSGWVLHAQPLPAAETQMTSFPKGMFDDLVDSVGSGVHFFLKDRKRPRRRVEVSTYA